MSIRMSRRWMFVGLIAAIALPAVVEARAAHGTKKTTRGSVATVSKGAAPAKSVSSKPAKLKISVAPAYKALAKKATAHSAVARRNTVAKRLVAKKSAAKAPAAKPLASKTIAKTLTATKPFAPKVHSTAVRSDM